MTLMSASPDAELDDLDDAAIGRLIDEELSKISNDDTEVEEIDADEYTVSDKEDENIESSENFFRNISSAFDQFYTNFEEDLKEEEEDLDSPKPSYDHILEDTLQKEGINKEDYLEIIRRINVEDDEESENTTTETKPNPEENVENNSSVSLSEIPEELHIAIGSASETTPRKQDESQNMEPHSAISEADPTEGTYETRIIKGWIDTDKEIAKLNEERWNEFSHFLDRMDFNKKTARNAWQTEMEHEIETDKVRLLEMEKQTKEYEAKEVFRKQQEDEQNEKRMAELGAALAEERQRDQVLKEELRELEEARRTGAATVIQKNFRRYWVRARIGNDVDQLRDKARRCFQKEQIVKQERDIQKKKAKEHQKRRQQKDLESARSSRASSRGVGSASSHSRGGLLEELVLEEVEKENESTIGTLAHGDKSEDEKPVEVLPIEQDKDNKVEKNETEENESETLEETSKEESNQCGVTDEVTPIKDSIKEGNVPENVIKDELEKAVSTDVNDHVESCVETDSTEPEESQITPRPPSGTQTGSATPRKSLYKKTTYTASKDDILCSPSPSEDTKKKGEVDSSVSKEKVESSVSKEKVDSSLSKAKVESSVSKEKVDSSLLKAKVESSVSKEKVDSSLSKAKVESSVSKEKPATSVPRNAILETAVLEPELQVSQPLAKCEITSHDQMKTNVINPSASNPVCTKRRSPAKQKSARTPRDSEKVVSKMSNNNSVDDEAISTETFTDVSALINESIDVDKSNLTTGSPSLSPCGVPSEVPLDTVDSSHEVSVLDHQSDTVSGEVPQSHEAPEPKGFDETAETLVQSNRHDSSEEHTMQISDSKNNDVEENSLSEELRTTSKPEECSEEAELEQVKDKESNQPTERMDTHETVAQIKDSVETSTEPPVNGTCSDALVEENVEVELKTETVDSSDIIKEPASESHLMESNVSMDANATVEKIASPRKADEKTFTTPDKQNIVKETPLLNGEMADGSTAPSSAVINNVDKVNEIDSREEVLLLTENLKDLRVKWLENMTSIRKRRDSVNTSQPQRPRRYPRSAKKLAKLPKEIVEGSLTDNTVMEKLTILVLVDLPSYTLSSLSDLCPSLQVLVMNRCGLMAIDGLDNCSKLQYVDFKDNRIEYLDLGSAPKESLIYLDLSYNRIDTIHGLESCTALRHLDLSENKIVKLGASSFPNLQWLNLNNNQLISTIGLAQCPHLQTLLLADNNLSDVPELDCLILLRELDLSRNSFAKTPNLSNNPLLERLVLDQNNVTSLQDLNFHWLPNLSDLSMKENNLQEIGELHLPLLSQLNVCNNQLQDLTAVLDALKSKEFIESIYLVGNQCSVDDSKRDQITEALPNLLLLNGDAIPGRTASAKVTFDRFLSVCLQHVEACSRRQKAFEGKLRQQLNSKPIDYLVVVHTYRRYFTDMERMTTQHREFQETARHPRRPGTGSSLRSGKERRSDVAKQSVQPAVKPVTSQHGMAPDVAATKISALYRGYRVRKAMNDAIDLMLHESAVKIQSLWRGYQVRKWIRHALEMVKFDDEEDQDNDFDMDDMPEVDLSHFDESQLDNMWNEMRAPPTPRLPSARNRDTSLPTKERPPRGPSAGLKTAWSNEHGDVRPESRHTRPTSAASRRTETIIDMDSYRSGSSISQQPILSGSMAKKKDQIKEDWGFSDDSTALLMLERAKKMKYNSEKKKKLSKLDPKQRFMLYRKLEATCPQPSVRAPKKTQGQLESGRMEYFRGKALERLHKQTDVSHAASSEATRTYQWVFSQPTSVPMATPSTQNKVQLPPIATYDPPYLVSRGSSGDERAIDKKINRSHLGSNSSHQLQSLPPIYGHNMRKFSS